MEQEQFVGRILRVTTEEKNGKIWERVYMPGSVHAILITDEGKIRLTTEKKIGRNELKEKFQAGIVEQGEQPLDAAKRELLEELGIEATSWEVFETIEVNETVNTFRIYYLARGLKEVSDNVDGEILSTADYTLDELFDRAMNGEFGVQTQAIIARLHYKVTRGEIRL